MPIYMMIFQTIQCSIPSKRTGSISLPSHFLKIFSSLSEPFEIIKLSLGAAIFKFSVAPKQMSDFLNVISDRVV